MKIFTLCQKTEGLARHTQRKKQLWVNISYVHRHLLEQKQGDNGSNNTNKGKNDSNNGEYSQCCIYRRWDTILKP